jgi:hypothetical protein
LWESEFLKSNYKNNNMKLKMEFKIYKQNFRLVYKDQTLHQICNNYLINIETMINHHGVNQTVIYHKELLRFMQQSCMDQDTTFNQNQFWTKMRQGFPTFLIKGVKKPMKQLMMDLRFRQGLMTICNIYKLLKTPINYDVSTIIQVNPKSQTSEYADLIEDINFHFKDFLKERKIKKFELNSAHNPVFATPKASASGPNALGIASIQDAIACNDTGIIDTQREIAKLVFTDKALNQWESLISASLSERNPDEKYSNMTGRLHFLQEGGGKTRVICIPDIWTQTVLKPIHDYLMKDVLKWFPCDGTFSHNLIAKRVRKFTKTGKLNCFDLRAATDRMPVDLQQKLLENLLPANLSTLWKTILVDREFYYPGGQLRYAVGQPMGMLSSWAAMAITNHAIINYSKTSRFYAVIGDDMAIASKYGTEKYEKTLEVLGMEISKEKSVLSTDKNNLGEIAKRLLIDGGEISPIPPDILIKSTGTLIGFLEFIRVFSEKFHHSDPGGFSDSEYKEILEQLFHNSKFKDDYDTHVLLTCPALEHFPILPRIPPLSGMRTPWRTDLPVKRLLNDLDLFVLREANDRTNKKVMELDPNLSPNAFSESPKHRKSPLYEAYRNLVKKELTSIIRRINTVYIDEEADSFAEGPLKDLKDILSYPNPLNDGISETYLSKRKLRLRNTYSLIQRFLDKTPLYQSPNYRREPKR